MSQDNLFGIEEKNPVFVIVDLFGCLLWLGLYFSSAITGGCLISQTGYYQPLHLSLILDFKNAHTKFPSSLEVRWGCRRLSDTFSAPADPHTPEVPRPFSHCHTLLLSLPLTHSPHSFFYILKSDSKNITHIPHCLSALSPSIRMHFPWGSGTAFIVWLGDASQGPGTASDM